MVANLSRPQCANMLQYLFFSPGTTNKWWYWWRCSMYIPLSLQRRNVLWMHINKPLPTLVRDDLKLWCWQALEQLLEWVTVARFIHDDVIKWKHFPRNWPFVRGIHRSPVNSPHKGQWRGALMFYLICVWINGWVNNREAGDLRRHLGHYDVSVMLGRVAYICTTKLGRYWFRQWLVICFVTSYYLNQHSLIVN